MSAPSVIDKLVEKSGAVGILCADTHGLCLGFRGDFGEEAVECSGRYTRLVRMAGELEGGDGFTASQKVAKQTGKPKKMGTTGEEEGGGSKESGPGELDGDRDNKDKNSTDNDNTTETNDDEKDNAGSTHDNTNKTTDSDSDNNDTSDKKHSSQHKGPIVTIETNVGRILVKEHDCLTVVMKMD